MPTEIQPSDCPSFSEILRCFKKLSESDVGNYFKIINKGDVDSKIVLRETTINNRPQTYKFFERLEKAKLIVPVSNGKKTYQVINPRKVFEESKEFIESIENEIGLLQEKYETTDFEADNDDQFLEIKNITALEHQLSKLSENGFEIDLCIQNDSKINSMQRFENYKKTFTNLDFILFKKEEKCGIILIDIEKINNNTKISGTKILSKNQYQKFKNIKNGK